MWQQHPKYKNYLISDKGDIKSKSRTIIYPDGHSQHIKGRIMHQYTSTFGYKMVKLTYNKKPIQKQVNDLVAETYIPNPNSLSETHHLDYDKTNNNVSNLEWVSHKYNMQDKAKYYHQKYLKNHPNIIETNKSYQTVKCPICGHSMDKNAKMCLSCRQKRTKDITISLKELQELLKNENGNFSKVAKKLKITSSAIHKRLKRHQLPYKSKDYKK